MYASAIKVLDYPDEVVSPFLKEQMLLQALVGALASGHPDRATALDREVGGSIVSSPRFAYARVFLNTWAISLQQVSGLKN